MFNPWLCAAPGKFVPDALTRREDYDNVAEKDISDRLAACQNELITMLSGGVTGTTL
jgi:hypothetical protein